MSFVASRNLVLGLDIGAASVGWALVEYEGDEPIALRASGVRVFEAGTEGDIAAGRDASRAAGRREKRGRRRLLARRRHRLRKLTKILQRAGLLPAAELQSADQVIKYFADLDRDLFSADARRADPHLLLHRLRARALDAELTPYEFGRALYHLAQRRGFLSNRRVSAKATLPEEAEPPNGKATRKPKTKENADDEGAVKAAIAGLRQEMQQSGARTLGEYFSQLNPEQRRVRNHYLGREMLKEEFALIWERQAQFHPDLLTDELKAQVHKAIFFQRPLKSQRHLIGTCDLEKGRPRAPMASLPAQRFRLLQKVNDLSIIHDGAVEQPLTPEQRATLLTALETEGDLSFPAIRELLSLPKRGVKFNFETEGEKGLKGNRTARDLRLAFGPDRWDAMSQEAREAVVIELRSVQHPDALKRRARKLWNLEDGAADRLAAVTLEDGYCNLSLAALARILPLMEKGMQFATARKTIYGEQPGPSQVTQLPRLESVLSVRNPAVSRALTETRKVVNALVREYGRPDLIRIELAREFKKNRKQRAEAHKQNAANRKAREQAAEKLLKEAGITAPRRRDIEKWLLAEECCWRCPYTGQTISRESLFGDHPQFDIEHIIPFPRCLDDSFLNKTLCHVDENRARKRNRTPWEAYHGTEQWEEILGRVKRFTGQGARAKLARFQIENVEGITEFASRQLNDTRYASRLAIEYLGLLYGADATGVADGQRRVQASRGGVTAFLRDEWQLNTILGGGEKTRDDHRQHLVDAVVVALTTPAAIKRLSDAAQLAPQARRRRFGHLPAPWPSFLDDVRRAVDQVVVSHRVSRKVNAALHEETIYSKPIPDAEGKTFAHVRKPLDSLSKDDIAKIVDPAVRCCVEAKLRDLDVNDPEKAFKDPANHPTMASKDGRAIPIHKVRLRTSVTPFPIAVGAHLRHVKLGSNHHVEILETKDRKGNVKWEGVVVSTYEAMHRLRARQPVVQRDHGPDKRFLFSLAGGEIIELDRKEGEKDPLGRPRADTRGRYVVRTISVSNAGRVTIDFAGIDDARLKKEIQAANDWYRSDIDPLRKRHCRKLLITPLGHVRTAND